MPKKTGAKGTQKARDHDNVDIAGANRFLKDQAHGRQRQWLQTAEQVAPTPRRVQENSGAQPSTLPPTAQLEQRYVCDSF